jgi:cellulose synthase/poly-beta-1,6-N-acetylglucosamine synthase-like glycosyltransferase
MTRLIFWLASALLAATYVGFPAIALLRGRLYRRGVASAPITPFVSVVIAAHNEERVIGERLANLLEQDYPADRMEVIVVSDGCTDGTVRIVSSYFDRGVRLMDPGRIGKGEALGLGVRAARGDVIVFSDANSMFERTAISALVRPLADESVGGVAGNQVYLEEGEHDAAAVGERGYWDFDRLLKRTQSMSGSITNATGAIYAIRREHFRSIPDGVTDDMFNSMSVIDAGARMVFAEDAIAYEAISPTARLEFGRKVRIMTRSFRCIIYMRRLLDPRRTGWYALQLFWHKIMLRTTVLPLIALAVISPTLWARGPIYRLATVGQAVCYALAVAGIATARSPLGRKAPLAIPAYFTLVNLASLRALLNLVRNERIDRWVPNRAVQPAEPPVRLLRSHGTDGAADAFAGDDEAIA